MWFKEGTCHKEWLWGEPRGLAWVARGGRFPGPSQSREQRRDVYIGVSITMRLWFRKGLDGEA